MAVADPLRHLDGSTASWQGADVISIEQLSRDGVELLFSIADRLRATTEAAGGCDALQHRVCATAFYEPSTRTQCSFSAAMQRCGGHVISIDSATSSVAKGETLADTVRCLECYADVLVLRHPEAGAARVAAAAASIPVINAGDGTGEHPTQALLDLYTIRQELKRVEGLKVLMVGDLKNGRTVHSLARLLALYKDMEIIFLAPESLSMPAEVTDYLTARDVRFSSVKSWAEVAHLADVVYVTRVQKERFASLEAYTAVQGQFVFNSAIMALCKRDMCVLHPLPRTVELAPEVDSDPRSAYFRQMRCGMYLRMGLLALVLGRAS